jgi:hypothetical protein
MPLDFGGAFIYNATIKQDMEEKEIKNIKNNLDSNTALTNRQLQKTFF